MQYRIIDYDKKYKEKLFKYIKVRFPKYSDNYIEYIISEAEGVLKSQLVVDEEDNIVGCHFWYNTKLYSRGEIVESAFGHDTYLEPFVRRYIGLDFVLKISTDKTMGNGLTDINDKIQKKLKTTYVNNVYNLFWISLLAPLYTLLYRKFDYNISTDNIVVGEFEFKRASSICDLNLVEDGFWYKDSVDYDIYRGADFLNDRFLKNKVHKYFFFYECKKNVPCYFVVRPIIYRKLFALLLVDFRYDISNEKLPGAIIKAVKKIANDSKLGVIMTTTSDSSIIKKMSSWTTLKKNAIVLLSKKLKGNFDSVISITPADSDSDFNR